MYSFRFQQFFNVFRCSNLFEFSLRSSCLHLSCLSSLALLFWITVSCVSVRHSQFTSKSIVLIVHFSFCYHPVSGLHLVYAILHTICSCRRSESSRAGVMESLLVFFLCRSFVSGKNAYNLMIVSNCRILFMLPCQ